MHLFPQLDGQHFNLPEHCESSEHWFFSKRHFACFEIFGQEPALTSCFGGRHFLPHPYEQHFKLFEHEASLEQ